MSQAILVGGSAKPLQRGYAARITGVVTLLVRLTGAGAAAQAKVTPLVRQELVEMDGKEGTMIVVEYAPGALDAAHRHDAHAFVYVLEGCSS